MSAQIDLLTASTRNRFSGVLLDRSVNFREDLEWQNQELQKEQTRLVPMWRNRCLLRKVDDDTIEAILVGPAELSELATIRDPTLLGSDGSVTYFALSINDKQRDELLAQYPDGEFQDLRLAAPGMIGPEAGILAYAKALHYWQHRHTFCGVCVFSLMQKHCITGNTGIHSAECVDMPTGCCPAATAWSAPTRNASARHFPESTRQLSSW
jgi:NADH pyrophosphatase NudC (nudix superfamily)